MANHQAHYHLPKHHREAHYYDQVFNLNRTFDNINELKHDMPKAKGYISDLRLGIPYLKAKADDHGSSLKALGNKTDRLLFFIAGIVVAKSSVQSLCQQEGGELDRIFRFSILSDQKV
jgi:hypothetical protein